MNITLTLKLSPETVKWAKKAADFDMLCKMQDGEMKSSMFRGHELNSAVEKLARELTEMGYTNEDAYKLVIEIGRQSWTVIS